MNSIIIITLLVLLSQGAMAGSTMAPDVPADVLQAIYSSDGYEATDANNNPIPDQSKVRDIFILNLGQILKIDLPLKLSFQKALSIPVTLYAIAREKLIPLVSSVFGLQPFIHRLTQRFNDKRSGSLAILLFYLASLLAIIKTYLSSLAQTDMKVGIEARHFIQRE